MRVLSSDLAAVVFDRSVSIVLAKVVRVRPAPEPMGSQEVGTIDLEVLRVFRSELLSAGSSFDVDYSRMWNDELRVKNRINQWNALSLTQGDLLLMGCQPQEVQKHWGALAALPLTSGEDPQVEELIQAIRINEVRAPESRYELLQQALVDGKGLLLDYALEAVRRGDKVPRKVGAELLEKAMASEKITPDERLELGRRLADPPLFDQVSGPDATNQGIIAALAQEFVADSDKERRTSWAELLAARTLMEFSEDPEKDREIRNSLIRGIARPSPEEVISVLSSLSHHGTGEDKELAKELLDAWRTATQPPHHP